MSYKHDPNTEVAQWEDNDVPLTERSKDDSDSPKENANESLESPKNDFEKQHFINRMFPPGSFFSAYVNMCKHILGSGILAMPIVMHNAGWALGILFLIIAGVFSAMTQRFIIIAVQASGYETYEELATHYVGKWLNRFTIFLSTFFFWGCIVSYVAAIGDVLRALQEIPHFPEVFQGKWGVRLLVTLFFAAVMFPLSLTKSAAHLRWSSTLGVVSVVYLTIAVVIHASLDTRTTVKNMEPAKWTLSTVNTIPICIFMFGIEPISLVVYKTLRPENKTVYRMTLMGSLVVTLASILFLSVGLAGLANFGNELQGNIFANLDPQENMYIAVAFLLFCVVLTCSFVIVSHVPRASLLNLFGFENSTTAPFHAWFTISGCISLSAVLCGLFAPGLEIIFSLLGAICGSALFFVLPCLFAIKTTQWTVAKVGWFDFITCYGIFIIGIICGVLGTVFAVMSTVKAYI